MKVLILCGGYGTRLAEETATKPKPMVKIGQKPILWHLIKYFNYYGFNDFILATKISKLIGIGSRPYLLIILSATIGGISSGTSAIFGNQLIINFK